MSLLLLFGASSSTIQTVTMQAQSGLIGHSIVLRSRDDGTEVDSQPATEVADGVYIALFINVPAGAYYVQLVSAAGAIVRYSDVTLTLDPVVFPVLGAGGGAGGGGGEVTSFAGDAAAQITAILETAASAVVNSGLQIATEGFPASLRIGDARTADNGRSLTLRVYDIDDPETPLSQIGTLALEDAKLTLGFTRPGETEPDVEIDCTFDSAGADYWIVIAWEKAALDDLDPNLKTQYLWGVKAEWGTVGNYSDPVTVADGKVWIRQAIVPNH